MGYPDTLLEQHLTGPTDQRGVAFSPDGKHRASVGDETIKVWDAHTGQELSSVKGYLKYGYVSAVSPKVVAFSPDGRRLASPSQDNTVIIWDWQTGVLLSVKGHTGVITGVVFSPEGKRLATASFDKTVRLWDAHTGQELVTLKGHDRFVRDLAFSPDGKHLASAGDGTVKVWDAQTAQMPLTLKDGTTSVVAFSPDGKR